MGVYTVGRQRLIEQIAERFMRYVSPEPNSGCWLWFGGADQGTGYGRFHLRVGAVHERRAAGEHIVDLAREFKRDRHTITNIVAHRIWA